MPFGADLEVLDQQSDRLETRQRKIAAMTRRCRRYRRNRVACGAADMGSKQRSLTSRDVYRRSATIVAARWLLGGDVTCGTRENIEHGQGTPAGTAGVVDPDAANTGLSAAGGCPHSRRPGEVVGDALVVGEGGVPSRDHDLAADTEAFRFRGGTLAAGRLVRYQNEHHHVHAL